MFSPFVLNYLKWVLSLKFHIKILHMGNTQPSCTCVIQEYWYNTMSLSQYHGCCQYHESMYIPWVLVNTISAYLYHDSFPVTWVNVYTMSQEIYIFFKYQNTNYRKTKTIITNIQFSEIQKHKLQKLEDTARYAHFWHFLVSSSNLGNF